MYIRKCTLYTYSSTKCVFFSPYDLTIANIPQLYTKLQMVQMSKFIPVSLFLYNKSYNFANSLSEHCEFHTYKWTIQYTVSEERENEREREEREYEREDARMNEISDGKPESTSEEVLSRSSLFSH